MDNIYGNYDGAGRRYGIFTRYTHARGQRLLGGRRRAYCGFPFRAFGGVHFGRRRVVTVRYIKVARDDASLAYHTRVAGCGSFRYSALRISQTL